MADGSGDLRNSFSDKIPIRTPSEGGGAFIPGWAALMAPNGEKLGNKLNFEGQSDGLRRASEVANTTEGMTCEFHLRRRLNTALSHKEASPFSTSKWRYSRKVQYLLERIDIPVYVRK